VFSEPRSPRPARPAIRAKRWPTRHSAHWSPRPAAPTSWTTSARLWSVRRALTRRVSPPHSRPALPVRARPV